MPTTDVFQFTQRALWLALTLSAPPIIVATVAGLIIAVLQAATQVQEQTVSYAVKFFAIVIAIFLTASVLGGALLQYTSRVMEEFPSVVKR